MERIRLGKIIRIKDLCKYLCRIKRGQEKKKTWCNIQLFKTEMHCCSCNPAPRFEIRECFRKSCSPLPYM